MGELIAGEASETKVEFEPLKQLIEKAVKIKIARVISFTLHTSLNWSCCTYP
jgi:hypothetical protein